MSNTILPLFALTKLNAEYGFISEQMAPVITYAGPVRRPQRPFRFYAAIFAWHEGDVIEATVKNLYAQGVDAVFLIDNCSPDDTVEAALRGGAIHDDSVHSERFLDSLKAACVTDLVKRTLADDGCERSWWLFCDADEFPATPDAPTLRAFIAEQDDAVRCIGSNFINHFPSTYPCAIPGFHPGEFQPEAWYNEDAAVYCLLAHDKHNCVRFDNGVFDLELYGGYHRFKSQEKLLEPTQGFFLHHFPYRDPRATLPRLERLVMPDETMNSRLGDATYYKKLAATGSAPLSWYLERYAYARRMYDPVHRAENFEKQPIHWKAVTMAFRSHPSSLPRWYTTQDLETAVRAMANEKAYRRWRLTWSLANESLEEYLALFAETPPELRGLAECLYAIQAYAFTGEAEKAAVLGRELVQRDPAWPISAIMGLIKTTLTEKKPPVPRV